MKAECEESSSRFSMSRNKSRQLYTSKNRNNESRSIHRENHLNNMNDIMELLESDVTLNTKRDDIRVLKKLFKDC